MLKMESTLDLNKDKKLNILVYGRAGVGKTRSVLTLPFKPIIFSAENGLLSLGQNVNIDIYKIKTFQDVCDMISLVKSQELTNYKCIFIDSLTEIGEIILSHCKATRTNLQQAYGEYADTTLCLIKTLRDLDKHIIYTAKRKMVEDEFNNRIMIWPSMPGKTLGPQLTHEVDLLLYLDEITTPDKTKKAFFQTKTSLTIESKDRTGCLDFYESPNFSNIFKKIFPFEEKPVIV